MVDTHVPERTDWSMASRILWIPGAKGKIGKAALVSADALDQVVHFEYLDVKIAEPAAGKIKAKESRILRNLGTAIDGGKASVALFISHPKNLKLIESFSVIDDGPLRSRDLPEDPNTRPAQIREASITPAAPEENFTMDWIWSSFSTLRSFSRRPSPYCHSRHRNLAPDVP